MIYVLEKLVHELRLTGRHEGWPTACGLRVLQGRAEQVDPLGLQGRPSFASLVGGMVW